MEQMSTNMEWTRVAEVELIYKTKVKASERPKVSTSKDSYEILLKLWNENRIEMQEEFKVLFLNRSNKVIGVYDASMGGITGTIADARLILAAALKALATAIILSHNHPSGNLTPSKADEMLTLRLKEAARFHDITVMDHVIISKEGYYSFADEGLL